MKALAAPATPLILTAVVLALGLLPLPPGRTRAVLDSVRSPELNRADRETHAAGYYEGLIGGGAGLDGTRSELTLRLLGKPAHWIRFDEAGVARVMTNDFLQFELLPNLDRTLFGQPFTTNRLGLRDREYTPEKPEGTFRIALLGSSMDMGWGVATEDTYENRLEDWLNQYAAKRGLARRFEVLNFAVAAYGPAQRLESYYRKARGFQPDLVLYSATMLDPRLQEIHLCRLLQHGVDLKFDFLHRAVADAALTPEDLQLDLRGQLALKDRVKTKLRPHLWPVADAVVGALAAECRSADQPLVCLIIPRVGKADTPEERAQPVARHKAIAAHHALPVIDLSDTFDHEDPARLEIAAWDDHPNALGHKLLFIALARALVDDPSLYNSIFME